MRIRIVSIGALKGEGLDAAAGEYRKRLRRYCTLEEVELPVGKHRQLEKRLEQEAAALEGALGGVDAILLLDREGHEVSSPELAGLLEELAGSGRSRVALVIGGPDGVAGAIRRRASRVLSFSRLTFPHQLFKVMLLEQVYRAFTIQRGEPYHK